MEKLKKLKPLTLVLILVFAFAAEALMSNYNYLAFTKGTAVENYRPAESEDTIQINKENEYFLINNLGLEITSLAFDVYTQNDTEDLKVEIYSTSSPEQETYSYVSGGEILADADGERAKFCFSAGEPSNSLYIAFSGFDGTLTVSNVVINESAGFAFNGLRFAVLLGAVVFIYFLAQSGMLKERHKVNAKDAAFYAVSLTLLASVLVSILNFTESGAMVPYPLESGVRYYNPYYQQFDAFQKGQFHLDVEPSWALKELENPYDPSARQGIDYMWDRAFFNGKYYSYFGLTPIVTVIYPFYWIMGMLPSLTFVMSIFSAMAAIFFSLTVIEWTKLRKGRSSFAFAAMCAVFAFLASQVLLMQRGSSQFYYVAGLSAMAFISAFMFWLLKAIGSCGFKKYAFYFLAGISFGLSFHARVNTVLPFALISAVFIILLMIKRIKEKKAGVFLLEALSLGAPVLLAVLLSFYYNYVRFGNPLDFGTAYQLTVADTSLYKLNVAGIIPSIYHYFIQNFKFTTQFPFVDFNYVNLGNYNGYVYVDSGLGIFAYPFTLILLLSPLAFRSKSFSCKKKILLSVAIVSLFVTAFADFCLGGVIFRYTADISLLAAFLSVIIAMEAGEFVWDKHGEGAAKMVKHAVAVLGGLTVLVAMGSTLIRHTNTLYYSPVLFDKLKDFFVFW